MPESHQAHTRHYETASLEARRGYFQRALKLLPRSSATDAHLKPNEMALSAELLQHTGDTTAAARVAEHLSKSDGLPPAIESRCLTVLGVCAFESGNLRRSTALLQKAVRVGEESLDQEATSHAMLCLLGRLTDVSAPSSTASLVADTGKLVAKANSREAAIRFHLILGRTEARRGILDAADRHFSVARSLLEATPNPWLEGLYCVDSSIVSYMRPDLDGAVSLANRALSCALRSGHQRTLTAALFNLGSIYLYKGDHPAAERLFLRASKIDYPSAEVRAAVLDGYADLELARRNLLKSEELLDQIDQQFPTTRGFKASWYQISPLALRVRLLREQANWRQSLSAADRGLDLARQRGDRSMECTFRVLKAETLIDLGRLEKAAAEMGEVAALVGSLPPTVAAEAARVRGRLLARMGEGDDGRRQLTRAVRILSVIGSAHAAGQARKQLAALPTPSSDRQNGPIRCGVIDAAALLNLSSQPELLGREALAMIADLDCAEGATLVEARKGRPLTVLARHRWTTSEAREKARAIEPSQRIDAGESDGQRYYIAAKNKPDLPSRDTLSAVGRLVATAVEVDKRRREEQRQGALLPFDRTGFAEGVFLSDEMLKLVAIARRIAASDLPVLITGETGTGKEVVARLIHSASKRAGQSFVAFNCTGLARDTAESQLFGHRRGSFTDAQEDASGVIRGVAGGTLLLDEIGELDHAIQPKLLRFLESSEVQPVGEARPVAADVRVIAATNAAIEGQVREGHFREDLFYRLNVIRLKVPPLRERREEIPSLVKYFIGQYERELKRRNISFSQDAMRCLLVHGWPGNVRQLGNEIRRAVAMAESGDTITPNDLSPDVQAAAYPASPDSGTDSIPLENSEHVKVRIDQPLSSAIEQVERVLIRRAISKAGGRVDIAARTLGVSRKGLFLKRRRLAINADDAS